MFSVTYAANQAEPNATLSEHLLVAVLNLLKKEVSEHGRHLTQYFQLFLMYSNLGVAEVGAIWWKLIHGYFFLSKRNIFI